MFGSSDKLSDLVTGEPVAQAHQALVHGWHVDLFNLSKVHQVIGQCRQQRDA